MNAMTTHPAASNRRLPSNAVERERPLKRRFAEAWAHGTYAIQDRSVIFHSARRESAEPPARTSRSALKRSAERTQGGRQRLKRTRLAPLRFVLRLGGSAVKPRKIQNPSRTGRPNPRRRAERTREWRRNPEKSSVRKDRRVLRTVDFEPAGERYGCLTASTGRLRWENLPNSNPSPRPHREAERTLPCLDSNRRRENARKESCSHFRKVRLSKPSRSIPRSGSMPDRLQSFMNIQGSNSRGVQPPWITGLR